MGQPTRGESLLAVAHPGHELAVHGWLETERPVVLVFTDGSGTAGAPRLDTTRRVLADAGASEGRIFGPYREQEIYDALLGGNSQLFVKVCASLSELLADETFICVAGEAMEGFNPTHDVWRCVVNVAVADANRRRRQPLRNRQFLLFGRQTDIAPERRQDALVLRLDTAAHARKLAAAQDYPELRAEVTAALSGSAQALLGRFPQLAERVRPLMERLGSEALAVECLFLADDGEPVYDTREPPFFEAYGECLAALGRFAHVIRYREHLLPVREALANWASARAH